MRHAVLLLCFCCLAAQAEPLPATGTIEPIFTPGGDAEGAILREIAAAGRSVRVQAFVLTSRALAKGLIAAHKRGIAVEVMADAEMVEEGRNSKVPALVAAGIPVRLEVRYAIAHNKIIIIDGDEADGATAAVITGSFNFTHSAQAYNAENLLILRGNPALVRRYMDNWRRHHTEALPYREVEKKR